MKLIDVTYENVKNVLDNHGYYHDEYKRFYDMSKLFPTIEVPTWIPVTERLPENYRKVLTCDAKGNMHINWHYEAYEHPFCISEDDPRFYPVTHWMPLPDSPHDSDVWERKFLGKWVGLHEDN